MKSFPVILDALFFQINYPYGHIFWDRLGQTILDIETQFHGWFYAKDEKNIARLENPENNLDMHFNSDLFHLGAKKIKDNNIEYVASEAQKAWKIIRANLGIDEFDRAGIRFQYLKPTNSLDETEKLLAKSDLNIVVPARITDNGYEVIIRSLVTFLTKENVEYRVELKGVTRTEGIDPRSIQKKRPSTMSQRQKEYERLKLRQFSEYSINPMYAVMLDIDCVNYCPSSIDIDTFIRNQASVVVEDILPVMEEL